jgi:hypothetical protein
MYTHTPEMNVVDILGGGGRERERERERER